MSQSHGGPEPFAFRGQWGLCYPERLREKAALTESNPSSSPGEAWPGLDWTNLRQLWVPPQVCRMPGQFLVISSP